MKNQRPLNWDFKQINPTDYSLSIETGIENKLMMHVFQKARTKLARKKGINVKGDTNSITRFDVPKEFYNLLKTILKKTISKITYEINQDGIELLNYYVERADFIRIPHEDWKFKIIFTGQMVDKR